MAPFSLSRPSPPLTFLSPGAQLASPLRLRGGDPQMGLPPSSPLDRGGAGLDAVQCIPLLAESTSCSDSDDGSVLRLVSAGGGCSGTDRKYRALAVLSGHVGSVSSLALCGEFVLSASQGNDIIIWQQPDLRRFAQFGRGEGSVKALTAVGNRVFTAHQDGRIRVWKVSRRSENAFRLVDTLPTTRDYLSRFMKQSNYVQTRRNHRKLWIEHADTISCLAVDSGIVYSGSWDRTLKVWRLSDLRCLESIRAHDDAINAVAVHRGIVYTASADGSIKAWERAKGSHCLKGTMIVGRQGAAWNAVLVVDEGRLVYGGSSDGRVMGWEWTVGSTDWRLVCDTKAHDMAILCMCSLGRNLLCSGSADRTIGLWKRVAGGGLNRVGTLRGHEGPVKCVQAGWKSVGRGFLLYSGGLDRSLRVWWVASGGEGEEAWELGNSGAVAQV